MITFSFLWQWLGLYLVLGGIYYAWTWPKTREVKKELEAKGHHVSVVPGAVVSVVLWPIIFVFNRWSKNC